MINSPSDLLKGYVELSSLPTVFMRINEAVNNPRSSMNDIGKIISEDAGLTARLLMVVNSAFFNFPQRIESITKAIGIVGTQQLRDLALATSIIKLFKGIPSDLVDMEKFWKHSVAVGIAARTLATLRREANIERFFVAGILHDIGRLVMYVKIPDLSREALLRARKNNELLYVTETEVIGFDHAAVGRALMQIWKLSSYQEEVVGFHHNPGLATRFPVETAIVHVADILAHGMGFGSSGEHYVPPMNAEVWERLALQVSVLAPACEQIDRQFDDAVKIIL
ncbi:MAG: HDOD domain-containing protein [Bacteroidetes bacterium]|nr:HDOD domain-containing protein [Bacteroidota bacterium]MCW5895122.1 HDOD domain-containing protein [Bacteroidota bacterium]